MQYDEGWSGSEWCGEVIIIVFLVFSVCFVGDGSVKGGVKHVYMVGLALLYRGFTAVEGEMGLERGVKLAQG